MFFGLLSHMGAVTFFVWPKYLLVHLFDLRRFLASSHRLQYIYYPFPSPHPSSVVLFVTTIIAAIIRSRTLPFILVFSCLSFPRGVDRDRRPALGCPRPVAPLARAKWTQASLLQGATEEDPPGLSVVAQVARGSRER